MMDLIEAHGGILVNRYVVDESERAGLIQKAQDLVQICLDDKNVSDLEMIADGAMSPLNGFMGEKDYRGVVENMRLSSGLVWSIPITLAVKKDVADKIKIEGEVALIDPEGRLLATMCVQEIYLYDKKKEARMVYGTDDEKHPGVAYVYHQGDYLLGGPIQMIQRPAHQDFREYRCRPEDTRRVFRERGWKSVVAFQTRNPIHRAHEYLLKCSLEIVDGLMVHPLVGRTKSDDISAEVRMRTYEVLLERYFPKERVFLAVFPAAMRYAGPREAVFHALVRKNYGCTHFIVGRDHAGVGTYYGTYDAQKIFDQFRHDEIGITPLKYEHAFYCKRSQAMATPKTSPSLPEERVFLSGTKVREMLARGEAPPPEFTRPEVAEILIEAMQSVPKSV